MVATTAYTKSLSRSKVALFLECPRCFYLDRVCECSRPPGFPFTLNSAVDKLLKTEFDTHRKQQTVHPLIRHNQLNLIPAVHPDLETWRANFKGIKHNYQGYTFSGAIDDLWIDEQGEYYVVDYKATAKPQAVTAINESYHIHYKRQIEFYQWLLRGNGLSINKTAFFVYATGDPGANGFQNQLLFRTNLITHEGDTSWIEPVLDDLILCLHSKEIPEASTDCAYCKYAQKQNDLLGH